MHKTKNVLLSLVIGLLVFVPALTYGASSTPPKLVPVDDWTDTGKVNAQQGLPEGSIYDIIGNTMRWLLAILGFIALIGFIIAGILYLTAAGNESQAEKAKNAMTYSIIGVIVALVGFVILQAAETWLGGSSTTF